MPRFGAPPPPPHGASMPGGMFIVDDDQGPAPGPPHGHFAQEFPHQHEVPVVPFPGQMPSRNIIHNSLRRISDLNPLPVKDEEYFRKNLTTYEVYALNKDDWGAKPSKDNKSKTSSKEQGPSWARVIISQLSFSHEDVVKKLKSLNESSKKVTDKVNKLYPHQQTQISNLLEIRQQSEEGPDFDWSVGQLEQNVITNKRTGKRETATIIVYLKRTPRQGANTFALHKRQRNQPSRRQQFDNGPDAMAEEMVIVDNQQAYMNGPPQRPMPPGAVRRRNPGPMADETIIVDNQQAYMNGPPHRPMPPGEVRRRNPGPMADETVIVDNQQAYMNGPPHRPMPPGAVRRRNPGPMTEETVIVDHQQAYMNGPPQRPMPPGEVRRRNPGGMRGADPSIIVVPDPENVPAQTPRARSRTRFDASQQRHPGGQRKVDQRKQRSRSRPRKVESESESEKSSSNSDNSSSEEEICDSDTPPTSPSSSVHRGRRPKLYNNRRKPSRQHSRGDEIVVENHRGNQRRPRYPAPELPRRRQYSVERRHPNIELDPVITEDLIDRAAARIAERISRPASPRTVSSIDDILREDDPAYRRRGTRRISVIDDAPVSRYGRFNDDNFAFPRRDESILRGVEPRFEQEFDRPRLDESRARNTEQIFARDAFARVAPASSPRTGFMDPYPFRGREGLRSLPLEPDRIFNYRRNPFVPTRQPRLYRS